jgi:hypothetical protein
VASRGEDFGGDDLMRYRGIACRRNPWKMEPQPRTADPVAGHGTRGQFVVTVTPQCSMTYVVTRCAAAMVEL